MLRLFLPQFQGNTDSFDLDTNSVSSFQMGVPQGRMSVIQSISRPKEFMSELLGTFLMVLIAKSGGLSLAVLTERQDPASSGSLLSGALASGIGVMVGILVTGASSGAHMNPAVTVAMAVWGRLPISAVPAFVLAQFLGAGAASALVLFIFKDSLGEAGAQVITSAPGLATSEVQLSIDQGVATFILLLVVCSVEDQGHTPPSLLVGLSVFVITLSMGANAGASMNPAVDFMPRVMASIWKMSTSPFTSTGHFWLVPFLIPYLGGVLGTITYQLCIISLRAEPVITKKVQFTKQNRY